MLKIWKALTWEYLSHAVHLSYAAVLVAIIGPWFGWALTGFVVMSPDEQTARAIPFYFSYVGIALFFYGSAAGVAITEMPRFCRLHPVSSTLLATFFWLIPPCLIMLLNVISQLGYQVVFGNTWPILTTTICLGAFSTMVIAGGWWLTTFGSRRLAVVGMCLSLWVTWFVSHFYRNGWNAPITVWKEFGAADIAVIVGTLVTTWLVTLLGVKRFRCGATNIGWLAVRMEDVPYATSDDRKLTPLPDAPTALLDMEWARSRYIAGCLAGVIIVLLVLLSVLEWRSDKNHADGLLAILSISSGYIGLAVGGWMGGDLWGSRSGELKSIHSTLPFSDAQLGGLLVRAWLKVTTVAWLMVFGAALVLFAICGILKGIVVTTGQFRDVWLVQQQGWFSVLVLPTGSFLIAWTLAGITGSVVLTGRKWLGFSTIITVPTIGIVLLLIYTYCGEPGQRVASILLLTVVVLVCCGGTICIYVSAVVRQLLTGNQACAYVIAAALLCAAAWTATPSTIYWKTIFTSLVCLSAVPFAGMPLAIAWNRHR